MRFRSMKLPGRSHAESTTRPIRMVVASEGARREPRQQQRPSWHDASAIMHAAAPVQPRCTPHGHLRDPPHLGLLQQSRIVQDRNRERMGIIPPKQRIAKRQCRDAEDAGGQRDFGAVAQHRLDLGRIGHASRQSQRLAHRLQRFGAVGGATPSAQIHWKIASIASGRLLAAIDSRSAGSGLNGCFGGKRSGTPASRACHSTWR